MSPARKRSRLTAWAVVLPLAAVVPWLPAYLRGAGLLIGGFSATLGAAAWGVLRYHRRNPFHQEAYGDWLAATPWMPGMRLPLGPLRPEPADLVPLLGFPAALLLLGPNLASLAPLAPVLAVAGYATAFSVSAWHIQRVSRLTVTGLALLPGLWAMGGWRVLLPATCGLLLLTTLGIREHLERFATRRPPLPPGQDPSLIRFLRSTLRGSVLSAIGPSPPWGSARGWAPLMVLAGVPVLPALLLPLFVVGVVSALAVVANEGPQMNTRFGARFVGIALVLLISLIQLSLRARPGRSVLCRLRKGPLLRMDDDWLLARAIGVAVLGVATVVAASSGPVHALGGDPLVWTLVSLAATQTPRLLVLHRDRWELTGPRRVWTASLRRGARAQARQAAKASATAASGKAFETSLVVGETRHRPPAAQAAAV